MLAATFNTLTDAIARFQREAALRERLSVLGRLSTVIAHEVRNPLMIIKGALRTLRRWDTADATMQEALLDIDNEVARLNRIVGDILDFARPIRLELAREDLNALCRKATTAALRDAENLRVEFALDAGLPPVLTDAERLRTVLVNVLANAREAVLAHRSAQQAREAVGTSAAGASSRAGDTGTNGPDPDVQLRTRQLPSGRVEVVVTDRGGGVDPALLPHIFEPYFTTKRTGTGLGLAIAKNIVDALGGTLSASRSLRGGTEIRLELAIEPAVVAGGVLAARVGARV
jgi:two-component system sensor histidine kinase HydH